MKTAHTPMTYTKPVYPHAHLPLLTHADVPQTVLMQTLYHALSLRREAGTVTEAQFVAWLCNRLPVTMIDGAGNIHVDKRTQPGHRTMFTAHTDTVHYGGGANCIRLDKTDSCTLWRADEGDCLGADDGAGIALLMHMMDAGVPGYYVFFREEECGGTGSVWLADHMADLLMDFDHCVSLDRADTHDVITHQAGGRCCSDVFALALADALTADDMTIHFTPCDRGVFTDSANLTNHISECTNLSVGYKHQHGDGEYQDVTFLAQLGAALVRVEWEKLPVERNPWIKPVKACEPGLWGGTGSWDYTNKGDKGTPCTFKGYDEDARTGALKGFQEAGAPLDDFETYMVDALHAAVEGHYLCIRGIVAEFLMPEDPDMAQRFVDPRALSRAEYLDYASELESGQLDYDTVLAEVVDALTIN